MAPRKPVAMKVNVNAARKRGLSHTGVPRQSSLQCLAKGKHFRDHPNI